MPASAAGQASRSERDACTVDDGPGDVPARVARATVQHRPARAAAPAPGLQGQLRRQAARPAAGASAGRAFQLPARAVADCRAVGAADGRARHPRPRAPVDAAGRLDVRAAGARLHAARDAARPRGAAVAVPRHRRPGRRERRAVRQGAPRHHRRPHLRQGGDAVADRRPEGQAGAGDVGRRAAAGQGRRPRRRRAAAVGGGSRCWPSRGCARQASARACRCPS